jgi:ribosomal protein S27E
MPKVLCRSAKKSRSTPSPAPTSGLSFLMLSTIYDRISETPIDPEVLYREMQTMVKCPHCGTLAIYWDGMDKPPQVYEPLSIASDTSDFVILHCGNVQRTLSLYPSSSLKVISACLAGCRETLAFAEITSLLEQP